MAFLTIVVELPEGEDEKKFMEMLKQNTDEKGLIAGACLESYCIDPLDPIGLLSVLAEVSPDSVYYGIYDELLRVTKETQASYSKDDPEEVAERIAAMETLYAYLLAEGPISENMDRLIAKEEGAEEAEAEKSPLIVPSQSILLH